MVNKTGTKIFHLENLTKGHRNFDRDRHDLVAKTVELNNNSALAVIHPGYCREIILNRIKHTSWPPVIYNTIKDSTAEHQTYFQRMSALISSTSEPVFVFCERNNLEKTEKWIGMLKPKAPVVLVETMHNASLPVEGWDPFAKAGRKLHVEHFNAAGEIRITVNSKERGCAVGFYNNLNDRFKIDLLTEYTFPNLSFEILTSELQRGDDIGAVLDPASSRYIFSGG